MLVAGKAPIVRKLAPTSVKLCSYSLTEAHGNITHPPGPGNYKKNEKCTWEFPVTAEQGLVIEFYKLSIAQKGPICDDFLAMPDGKEDELLPKVYLCVKANL